MIWTNPKQYDVIVIGSGHAGCEAAHAAAQMGCKTCLITMNLDTIGKLSCNPSIGGTAKGHLVREIDAIGGLMGIVADTSAIHSRMLNSSKGEAVWSPRAQVDRTLYQTSMKSHLERTENLDIVQDTVLDIHTEKNSIVGITTSQSIFYRTKTIVLSSGTFMKGLIHLGDKKTSAGRSGDKPCNNLSGCLEKLGFKLGRLKTGTPARIHKDSVNYDKLEVQESEEDIYFSYFQRCKRNETLPCYITHTNKKTQSIIQSNLDKAPIYTGQIESNGPRYCPSIETKYERFDRDAHQVFIEPEGLHTAELYLSGLSTSLPAYVQYEMIRSIEGFENAHIMRIGYAIEYDYLVSGQIKHSYESKHIHGLFFSGQINGTTGYEEAAAQGIMAGINAAKFVSNKPALVISRSEGYIGVMTDDLVTKTLQNEPYRVFTSRAEYRLLLRQDNSHLRLSKYGYECGILREESYQKVTHLEKELNHLSNKMVFGIGNKKYPVGYFLNQQTNDNALDESFPDISKIFSNESLDIHRVECKYDGYIKRQQKMIEQSKRYSQIKIPLWLFDQPIEHIRAEAYEKLKKHQPQTIDQASRIMGITTSDLQVLILTINKTKQTS
ncbi:tRNA uridine-5-carboxymethylaminomethyl(34) synthesis enzyme MnmG [Chlamydiia bacterium]|nr:tRNA uridine-5-carboxymethylaminomethyl(34) synthesis enzyme MnmG [Chlamydiia bacterium]